MAATQIQKFIDQLWDQSIIPTLYDYIKIPNKSPTFDPDWQQNGYMDQAVKLLSQWCEQHPLVGMKLEVIRHSDRTPLIFIDIPGSQDKTILLYGHLDKQPEMAGWEAGLGPWQPVLRGDKLYGRGAADDGYSIFAAMSAILALQEQKLPHPRCVVLIEACEESGSVDLPYYINQLQKQIGNPELIICLDSGCGNYDQLWCTTSLRGVVGGKLEIEVLTEGVHSGNAGGIVPSPFLVLRQLLSRLENENTGDVFPQAFNVTISPQVQHAAEMAATVLAEQTYAEFPFAAETKPLNLDPIQLVLNRTWRPALTVTGIEGVPAIANAGNVLLPKLAVKLSLRIPPTCDAQTAAKALTELLESNPPFEAKIKFTSSSQANGWSTPEVSPQLGKMINEASLQYFGKPAEYMGEGGTIPFMSFLGERFPTAQFFITGVLGPQSNAHGPNEFLHIPTGKKVSCCIAHVIVNFCK